MLFSRPSEAENLLAAVQTVQISYSCVTRGGWGGGGCDKQLRRLDSWFSEALCCSGAASTILAGPVGMNSSPLSEQNTLCSDWSLLKIPAL